MYDSHSIVFSQDPETGRCRYSDTLIADLTGKSRKTIGRLPFSDETARAVVAVMPQLHKEVALFSYEPRLFSASLTLRELEEQARALLNALGENAPAEQIADAFEAAIEKVTAPFHETIAAAHQIRRAADTRKLSSEEMTTAYFAASILFTMALIWEKAADEMYKAQDREPLDFLWLGIDHAASALEALEFANELYGIVQLELFDLGKLHRAQSSRTDAYRGMDRELHIGEIMRSKLARQDSEIAALNMVSIGSHAHDWKKAGPNYLAITGHHFDEAARGLDVLVSNLNAGLPSAVGLLKRMPDNDRLARNLAYFAIQGSDPATLKIAAAQLSRILGTSPNELWAMSIVQRKPLCEEPHLKELFQGGKPAIWQE